MGSNLLLWCSGLQGEHFACRPGHTLIDKKQLLTRTRFGIQIFSLSCLLGEPVWDTHTRHHSIEVSKMADLWMLLLTSSSALRPHLPWFIPPTFLTFWDHQLNYRWIFSIRFPEVWAKTLWSLLDPSLVVMMLACTLNAPACPRPSFSMSHFFSVSSSTFTKTHKDGSNADFCALHN